MAWIRCKRWQISESRDICTETIIEIQLHSIKSNFRRGIKYQYRLIISYTIISEINDEGHAFLQKGAFLTTS